MYFDVDTTTITIKLKDINKLNNKFSMVRKNKLGFIDLKKSPTISIEEFVDMLSKEEFVDTIIYSTYGKYNSFTPNDSNINNQWYLSSTKVMDAWNITTGNPSVIVAVLDSGTDWTHSDLGLGSNGYQNIYLNTGEDVWSNQNNPTTGNGIDDDRNSFIDDWKGWNFANNSNDVRTTAYHGTVVSGIISAKTHNSHGIAGIAGGKNGEGVKLLPYCVGVSAPVSSIIDDAIIAAVDNGARIIQLSLSVSQSADIDAAITYAVNNNVLIICAAGNDYSSTVSYPASNKNVISVGAIDRNNQRVSFSNYGDNLDIVAPGVDIYSTTLNNGYNSYSGTSFAAPQVAGIAALILATNPNLTGQQVRNIIEQTAQKVGGYPYNTAPDRSNGSWHEEMGYGLVDAAAAVQQAPLLVRISGPDQPYSLQQVTYTLLNLSTGATVSWSGSSNVVFAGSTTGASVNVKLCGSYSATLTATVTQNGTSQTYTKTIQVNNGELTVTPRLGAMEVWFNHPYAQCYDWRIGSGLLAYINGSYTNGNFTCSSDNTSIVELSGLSGSQLIEVRAQANGCYTPWQSASLQTWTPEIKYDYSYLNPMRPEPFFVTLTEDYNGASNDATYYWYFDDQLFDVTDEPYIHSYDWPCGEHILRVVAVVDDRYEAETSADFWGMCGGGWSYAAYPNPAGNTLTVSRKSGVLSATPGTAATQKAVNHTARLYNAGRQLVREQSFGTATELTLDVAGLPNGTYFLSIFENGKVVEQQTVIVEH